MAKIQRINAGPGANLPLTGPRHTPVPRAVLSGYPPACAAPARAKCALGENAPPSSRSKYT